MTTRGGARPAGHGGARPAVRRSSGGDKQMVGGMVVGDWDEEEGRRRGRSRGARWGGSGLRRRSTGWEKGAREEAT